MAARDGGPIAASQRSCASRCWLWCARSIPATAQNVWSDAAAEHLAEEDRLLVHPENAAPLDARERLWGRVRGQPREQPQAAAAQGTFW